MKPKAFTILEILLAMVLIGIIITMIYTLIIFLNRQMLSFQEENRITNASQLFTTAIRRDLHTATDYSLENGKLKLIDYKGDSLSYYNAGNYIIRINRMGVRDSLYILNSSFEEKKTITETFLIFDIRATILKDTLSYVFFKKKSRASVLNKNFLYEN